MNKWVIVIGILILVGLGFMFISGMTGNVITGAVAGEPEMIVERTSFRISDFGSEELNEEVENNGESESGSK